MAYTYPEDYLAWYISGDKIALVTKKNTSSKNIYESIDESQDDGILIEYSAEPHKVENISDVPDCDNTLHTAIVNYLKWKLYEDGNDEGSILGARRFRSLWTRAVKEHATRDKVGGSRQVIPFSLR